MGDDAEKVCPFCSATMVPIRTDSGALRCSVCNNHGTTKPRGRESTEPKSVYARITKKPRRKGEEPEVVYARIIQNPAGRAGKRPWAPGVGSMAIWTALMCLFVPWSILIFAWPAHQSYKKAKQALQVDPTLRGAWFVKGGWILVIVGGIAVAVVLAAIVFVLVSNLASSPAP